VDFASTELRAEKAGTRDSLATLLGANGAASGWRCAGVPGIRGSLGAGRDRRVATLPYFDFTVSGAIDQSDYVLRDEEHVEEARNLTDSSV
jgi:hypothetical protein